VVDELALLPIVDVTPYRDGHSNRFLPPWLGGERSLSLHHRLRPSK
jgi:hypothetical protein